MLIVFLLKDEASRGDEGTAVLPAVVEEKEVDLDMLGEARQRFSVVMVAVLVGCGDSRQHPIAAWKGVLVDRGVSAGEFGGRAGTGACDEAGCVPEDSRQTGN